MHQVKIWTVAAALGLAAAAACGKKDAGSHDAAPVGVVDSAVPAAVALARFQAGVPNRPQSLSGGRDSREALVSEVVRALAQQDTMALEPIALNRAEFAYLYFPTAPIAAPPYELPPALAWFQAEEANRKGVFRALREYGGKEWKLQSTHCPAPAKPQGQNRIWEGCTVTMSEPGKPAVSVKLFGSIIERDGHFKILSYANDL